MNTNKDYQPDRPIENRRQDEFNRWPFAERIADTIGRSNDPTGLVIGIYGEWGDGKSSTLNLMSEALKKYEDIILIKFNPWYFNSEDKLIEGFFSHLVNKLDKSLKSNKEKMGIALKTIGSLASLASISSVGGILEIDPGSGISKIGEKLSETDLDKQRAQVEKILNYENKRIVVLIDDIDRLDKNEIQAVFKLVKLSANFKFVTYILAFDVSMVAMALAEKYGGQEGGRRFVEKIIQVPLHLPEADSLALTRFIFGSIESALALSDIALDLEQRQIFMDEFPPAFQRRLKTPRQARRYANTLAFALPILKGEVNPVDQMLIEAIRVFYPDLYSAFRNHSNLFLGNVYVKRETAGKKSKVIIDDISKALGLDEDEKEALDNLINHLFPRFYGRNSYGSDWDNIWNTGKRVCSNHHFQRYFSYTIPTGDVSDSVLDNFLSGLSGLESAVTGEQFNDFLKDKDTATRLIEKLRFRENTINPEIAKKLVALVAEHGSDIPNNDDIFFTSPFPQAAILVSNLICRISRQVERQKLAETIIMKAKPLNFAVELFRWLQHSGSKPETERKLSANGEKKLGELLAARIKKASSKKVFYMEFPNHALYILWVWRTFGNKSDVELYLNKRFSKSPKETSHFLLFLTPTAYGGGKVLPYKSDFDRNTYNSTTKLIEPDLIMKKLRKAFGKRLNDTQYRFSDEISPEHRVSNQFAFFYRQDVEETKKLEALGSAESLSQTAS